MLFYYILYIFLRETEADKCSKIRRHFLKFSHSSNEIFLLERGFPLERLKVQFLIVYSMVVN